MDSLERIRELTRDMLFSRRRRFFICMQQIASKRAGVDGVIAWPDVLLHITPTIIEEARFFVHLSDALNLSDEVFYERIKQRDTFSSHSDR